MTFDKRELDLIRRSLAQTIILEEFRGIDSLYLRELLRLSDAITMNIGEVQ